MDVSINSFNLSWITYVLMAVGLWKIFKKCGIDSRWALVPVYRWYKLSICARREEMGIGIMVASAVSYLLQIAYMIVTAVTKEAGMSILMLSESYDGYGDDTFSQIIMYVRFAVVIVKLVYSIRIYVGLCETFGKRKAWVWAWLFLDGLVAVYWGFSKKILPVTEEETELDISGLKLRKAEGILDIDIRSRKATDFLNTKELLKDIKLKIEPGNMVLLLGGSGAGKTTFVNAVTGYEKADATVSLGGKDVYRQFESMKYDIGFVPQMDLIRYNDTVRKTVEDAALLKLPVEVTKEEREEKIQNTLEIFGLHTVQNNLVGKQSGGQKKRTSIATEFVSDPSLFILDEPDSGLDGVLARDLMERLHAIAKKGKIVIVITHSPDRVIDLFDRVIILAKDKNGTGRLVFEGSVDECRSFFGRERMEDVVKMINRRDEGGEGMGDELIEKFGEMRKNQQPAGQAPDFPPEGSLQNENK